MMRNSMFLNYIVVFNAEEMGLGEERQGDLLRKIQVIKIS
jgi:hypothetical protein